MKTVQDYEKDIASIRTMMERSSKVLSLSGLSGMLSGVYALLGAAAVYRVMIYPRAPFGAPALPAPDAPWLPLVIIGLVVLVASLATGLWLSHRKAEKQGMPLWNAASRLMIRNMSVPLVSGGIFILIMLNMGYVVLVAPACLIFYGIALIHGSANTFDEVRYLGFLEILLGLTAALFPGYGLLFWAAGFGLLHIVYGAFMFKKYEA